MKYHKLLSKTLGVTALTGLLAMGFSTPATTVSAKGEIPQPIPTAEKTAPVTGQTPQTAEDHQTQAENYRKKAAEYQAEADFHHKMLADYKKRVPHTKEGLENSYVKKMRLHCQHYITSAEALAREAEKMAEFHTLRAKELKGN